MLLSSAFDINQVQRLDRLFINVQRRVQQTATGLTTANSNMPYLLIMSLLDTLQKSCNTDECHHYVVPLYSPNMNSRITFFSCNDTIHSDTSNISVRHTLTLHIFKSQCHHGGFSWTGLLILEADPINKSFYAEIDVLVSTVLHADSIIYIVDLPMSARFASSQLEEDFCVRSMLGKIPGVLALEGHEKLSIRELRDSFKDILEDTIADILSGLLECTSESSNKATQVLTSFILIYVPVTCTILDECYLASMSPHLHKLSKLLAFNI
ncbi:Hypothetical protein GLP15_1215 [Giardia lamblia P15]|uniref:Uncharacterized protein n=1 Tax=Giardia intestinalis (strain P15) TaxID=658858 RepID=E1EZU5_GIAIA|nr:Hypothetical protein GLP15_1215 [Giardia lamblia P15]